MLLLRLLPLAFPLLVQEPVPRDAPAATADASSFAEVGAALAEKVEDGVYRGVVAVVEIDGERVVEEVHGRQNADPERPMEIDSIFRIYSMSKPITAVTALTLVDEGRLGLDDPVSKYLPALADLSVGVDREPLERGMTVRDLMRHTAGLTYGVFAASEVDELVAEAEVLDPQITLEEMVRRLGELPLKTQPGTTFEYSVASDVLGRVIEVVTEKPLDEVMRERVFEPLGMVDTGFSVPAEKRDRVADVHRRSGAGLVRADVGPAWDPTVKPELLSGGGGLFSTARDYLRFCRMLLSGGELDGERILAAETVAQMTSDQLADLEDTGSELLLLGGGFGLGIAVFPRGSAAGAPAGTSWWGGLAGTGFWIDPVNELVAVFLIQNMGELNHAFALQEDVYEALSR